MKLIGITGKARSGKDTVAKYLWSQYAFTRIAFADPIKLAAQQMFGLSRRQTWDDEFKEVVIPFWGLSPRQIFQKLGNDASKPTFGDAVWCRRWRLSYDILKDTDDVVIPDVRFDVEIDMIRELGGVIVNVVRGNGLEGSTGAHASEAGTSTPPDYVLMNDGTFDELYFKLDALVELLK